MKRILYCKPWTILVLALFSGCSFSGAATQDSGPRIIPTVAGLPSTQPQDPLQPTLAISERESPTTAPPIVTIEAVPSDEFGPGQSVFYNLPSTILVASRGLSVSPKSSQLISPVELAEGETVYVLGRNTTSDHLRVVWNTGVGWLPTQSTTFNGQRDQLEALPEFTRVPPPCAQPIATQFNVHATWTSDGRHRVGVIIDLFRSQYGELPSTYLSLTVNGSIVGSTRRDIIENGQFSLKDVVFTLPGYLQTGDQLGYMLETTSDEIPTFIATIFSIPENCQWEGVSR